VRPASSMCMPCYAGFCSSIKICVCNADNVTNAFMGRKSTGPPDIEKRLGSPDFCYAGR
jgi:hypothetical protein